GPHRARLAADRAGRGAAAILEPGGRQSEGLLLAVRLAAVGGGSDAAGRLLRPARHLRLRSRRPAFVPPVRRLRRRLGAAPRRRPAALSRATAAYVRLDKANASGRRRRRTRGKAACPEAGGASAAYDVTKTGVPTGKI